MTSSLDGLKEFLSKYDCIIESRKNNSDLCAEEFQAVKQQSVEDKKDFFALEGAKEVNKKKNRYKDILPYDHTRVVLPKEIFREGSDYINANHIEDESGIKSYIASQAPMANTVDDFWRMIWHFKIKVVIMACKEIEMGKSRCQRYWPNEGEECKFNDIKINLVDSKQHAHDMVIRELKAEKNGKKHILTQLHYLDWPDHGAPETTETILQLIAVLREKSPEDHPPILIHCSAGCGRTGAIIATDYGRKLIKAHKREISVFKVVSHLRKMRPALVQSKEQYEFLYEVFRAMVTKELRVYESQYDSDYMNFGVFPKNSALTPSLAVADKSPVTESSKKIFNNKRQIVLPVEHVVNTDSSGIRRSRSAYGMKSKKNASNLIFAPPVPVKENKLSHSKEQLENDGPEFIQHSPGSPKKQPLLPFNKQTINQLRGNAQVPPVKPKLSKKPSLDSFFYDKRHLLENSAESQHSQEDFIPAPTPVGYSSYPMLSKMAAPYLNYPGKSMKPTIAPRTSPPLFSSDEFNLPDSLKLNCVEENKQEKTHSSINPNAKPNKHNFSEIEQENEVTDNTDKQRIIQKIKSKKFDIGNSGSADKNCRLSGNNWGADNIRFSGNNLFYTGEHESECINLNKTCIGDLDEESDSKIDARGCEYAVVNLKDNSVDHKYVIRDGGYCEYAIINKMEKNKVNKTYANNTESSNGYLSVNEIGTSSKGLQESPKNGGIKGQNNINSDSNINNNNMGDSLKVNRTASVYDNVKDNDPKLDLGPNSSEGKSVVSGVLNDMSQGVGQGTAINPYMVTAVGFGYKKDPSWSVNIESTSTEKPVPKPRSPERMFVEKHMEKGGVKSTEKVRPLLPSRRSGPLSIKQENKPQPENEYAEIIKEEKIDFTVDHATEASPPVSPQSGFSWLSNIVRTKGKKLAVSSATSHDGISNQVFNINEDFRFPKRLPVKPKGPRSPPRFWKSEITP